MRTSILALLLASLAACHTRAPGPLRVEHGRVGVVLIDAQPSFVATMHGDSEPVLQRLEQLLVHASITDAPVLATFEVPTERNGELPARLEAVWPQHGVRHLKRTFDCCREPAIRTALREMGVEQVVVAGAETDVCVLQSCLGLLEMGFEVFLLEDCVFSNEPNVGPALRRMQQAGVVPTTFKTYFYEVERSVAADDRPPEWRARWEQLREHFRSPYKLAPSRVDERRKQP